MAVRPVKSYMLYLHKIHGRKLPRLVEITGLGYGIIKSGLFSYSSSWRISCIHSEVSPGLKFQSYIVYASLFSLALFCLVMAHGIYAFPLLFASLSRLKIDCVLFMAVCLMSFTSLLKYCDCRIPRLSQSGSYCLVHIILRCS